MNIQIASELPGEFPHYSNNNLDWVSYYIEPITSDPVVIYVHAPSEFMLLAMPTEDPVKELVEQYSLFWEEATGVQLSVAEGLLQSNGYRRRLPKQWRSLKSDLEMIVTHYSAVYGYSAEMMRYYSHMLNDRVDRHHGTSGFSRHMVRMGYADVENRFNYNLMLATGSDSELVNYLTQEYGINALIEEALR